MPIAAINGAKSFDLTDSQAHGSSHPIFTAMKDTVTRL
jgi:hypothetical protein